MKKLKFFVLLFVLFSVCIVAQSDSVVIKIKYKVYKEISGINTIVPETTWTKVGSDEWLKFITEEHNKEREKYIPIPTIVSKKEMLRFNDRDMQYIWSRISPVFADIELDGLEETKSYFLQRLRIIINDRIKEKVYDDEKQKK